MDSWASSLFLSLSLSLSLSLIFLAVGFYESFSSLILISFLSLSKIIVSDALKSLLTIMF